MIRITIILLIIILNILLINIIYIIIICGIYNIIRYINTNHIENKIGISIKKEKDIDIKGYIIFLITKILIFLTFLSIYILFNKTMNRIR